MIESRIKNKISTYAAFIDFKKAYDSVHRATLWRKLQYMGVNGKLFNAVKSLYDSVSACVRVNGFTTEWFDVQSGLRQGCCLSLYYFNYFIDDLAVKLKALGLGIDVSDQEKLCILLYADDVVLLADSEADLQLMLTFLDEWCNSNYMSINTTKSNVVHFRPKSSERTRFQFSCGSFSLSVTDRYIYLGLTLTEYLDYSITAHIVSQSASRALGLLIAKYKSLGGMPLNVFRKLFDATVWATIAYGAAVWGTQKFLCIEKIQNRAMRYFLGTSRSTPNAAIAGDLGWESMFEKQMECVVTSWYA